MKNEKLFSAFGLIDDRYIIQAAPKKQEKAAPVEEKKTVLSPRNRRFIAVAACVCLIFALGFMLLNGAFGGAPSSGVAPIPGPGGNSTGVDRTPEPGGDSHSTEVGSTPGGDSSSPEEDPFLGGSGGEGYPLYDSAYVRKLNASPGRLTIYVEETTSTDMSEWFLERDAAVKKMKYVGSNPDLTPFLVQIIREFNVPKEVLEEENEKELAFALKYGADPETVMENYDILTQEEIDIIYSGSDAAIAEHFATPYAIISNGKAYAPRFYINATDEELAKYGITRAEVEEKIKILRADGVIERGYPNITFFENPEYQLPYVLKVYRISNRYDTLSNGTDTVMWMNEYIHNLNTLDHGISSPDATPPILDYIRDFNITFEDMQWKNNTARARFNYFDDLYHSSRICFTDAELDVLYSGDAELFRKTFASPYAIFVNGKGYAPAVFLGATDGELTSYGITKEQVEAKRQLLLKDGILTADGSIHTK